jgi:arsenite/tail-anchored protein-transporting ATPase
MLNAPRAETPFLFFTGKGGVGKTTAASAAALRLAESGLEVLLVSTDPASNLDDVFEMKVGSVPTPVPGVGKLSVMNIDPEAAAIAYRERIIGPFRGVLPDGAVHNMEEQLSGACTVEIAAFNEFTALIGDADIVGRFDHVVFDTAPTGHTLRLLSLPSAWTGFMETSSSGASCLGPLAGLEAQRSMYDSSVQALGDPLRTTVVLVARPEPASLREAARTSAELSALGMQNQRLVINGVLEGDAGDRVAAAYIARQEAALAAVPPALAPLPRTSIPLLPLALTGIAAIRGFGVAVAEVPPSEALRPDPGVELPGLAELVDGLATDGRGVIMTMGKGGVGKTSVAAAIALRLARDGHAVHLSTTDPAAHVDEKVGEYLPETLRVSRIDPVVETERYASEVIAAAGELEPDELGLLQEDLRSPCTEEIAVFRAFARTVAEATDAFVVLDTAPTGHTLLLLDAAESYHREVARATSSYAPEAVRALLPRLRDPRFTKILVVTLAESTPVLEAERLQSDLRRAGIEPYGWVVNACLAATGTSHPVLAARARLELPLIHRITRELGHRSWLIGWMDDQPAATGDSGRSGIGRTLAAKSDAAPDVRPPVASAAGLQHDDPPRSVWQTPVSGRTS